MSTHNRCMMIILALVLVSATTVQMVSAAGEQSWRLLGEDNEYTGVVATHGSDHLIDCNMSKTLNATKSYKDLIYTKTMWWYAEYPAQCNLTFPAGGDWIVIVDHEARSGWNWSADVYKVDSDGTATSFAIGTELASATGVTIITCNQGAEQTFDISNGDRLALRIRHDDNTETVRTYFYKGTHLSNLTSPPSDPGYPVPELSTIILVSAGLLILAGYAYMTRGNKTHP